MMPSKDMQLIPQQGVNVSDKFLKAIIKATPGRGEVYRMAFCKWIIEQHDLIMYRTDGVSTYDVINPHRGAMRTESLVETLAQMKWPTNEQIGLPAPVDLGELAREVSEAYGKGEASVLKGAASPIAASGTLFIGGVRTVIGDKTDDRKTSADKRDELITRIFTLKTKRAEMLQEVAKVSLEIAALDIEVAKATHKSYSDRKASRENDHGN